MEISRQRDAFAFRTATDDEHVPNAPAGHRSPEPPFGLSKDGWWHGSPAGDLRGAFYGLHVGTYDAARQALESRIGTPADGKPWDGTRTLGETLLAYGVPGTPYYREYHVGDGVPGETTGGPWDYTQVTYSDGTPVPLDSKPTMLPVRITGPMTNTPDNPHTDARANALMKGLITRGQARRGFYYVNDSEDENSISAVVPNADHLEIYHPDLGWHSYNAPITAALNMIRTAEEAHLEWDHSFSTGEWELEKADEQRIIDVMRKRHEMSQGQNRSATRKLAKDIVLYRGFGLDFREPGMEKIKAITHPHFDAVPGESLVEAYDRSQKDEAEGVYDHPDLGPHILDYLSSGRGPGGYTLGSHWTPDISVAQDWSRHRGRTPVVLKVRIPGDTKKKTFNPGWKYEKEWPMPAGTPVNVEEVHLWNPRDVVWHNVLQEPSVRYASMDPILLAQNMQTSTFAYRLAAEAFDPDAVTKKLEDEFYEWTDQQSVDKYTDQEWNLGIGHWPMVEDFLKDRYPAVHRGFMNGQEDAEEFLDNPDEASPLSRYNDPDEYGEVRDYSYSPEPYQTDYPKIRELGYDPSEIAAGMVLLHNKANRGGGHLDKERLVDIFNKRQQMQRAYEKAHHAIRLAYKEIQSAFNQDLIDRLSKEFDDWWYSPSMDDSGLTGGMMYWPNIESFLKQQYPAAHRNLQMGREQAGNLLDDKPIRRSIWLPNPQPADPYETGPEAISQYGYDPKEIAAGMLWLHNRSHGPKRDKLIDWDANRLNDIAQKRYRMQHAANIFR